MRPSGALAVLLGVCAGCAPASTASRPDASAEASLPTSDAGHMATSLDAGSVDATPAGNDASQPDAVGGSDASQDAPTTSDGGSALSVGPLASISAPGANEPFVYLDSIPIGWGYMDPMVVTIGTDVYTPMHYPTNLTDQKTLYNLQLVEDGVAYGPPLSFGSEFLPAGYTATSAYQPALLFASGTKILALYWALITNGQPLSIINYVSLDTAAASPAWTLVSTAQSPAGDEFNYLGGAMDSAGNIYVAGWDSNAGASALRLDTFSPGGDLLSTQTKPFSGTAYEPLYPQVAVDSSGAVYIMTVLSNFDEVCESTGATYTNYKDVVMYKVTASSPLSADNNGVFSDASPDVATFPATNGDPCQPYDSRFPVDILVDDAGGHVYSALRSQDVAAGSPPVTETFTQTIEIYDETGVLVVPDVTPWLRPAIPAPYNVDALAMTKVGGTFILFGSSRDEQMQKNIGITTTADFKTFTPAVAVATPYGPGNSVKVWQPSKNGSGAIPGTAYFWFCGNLINTETLNRFLDFELGSVHLPM